MELSLQELLSFKFFSSAQVLTGQKKLANMVTSVTILDSPYAPRYIKPGDLVLTTAYSLLHNATLQKTVIEELADAGAAGLGIILLFYNGKLPDTMKTTADKLNFPIISIPNESAYPDIYEFINKNMVSRVTGEIKRQEEVFMEINECLSQEGFIGLCKILYKWTGIQTIIFYNNNLFAFPNKIEHEKILKDKTVWHKKNKINSISIGVDRYYYKIKDGMHEALAADIKDKGFIKGNIILLKGERDFTKDDYILLESAASACTIEIKRVQSLVQIKRKYGKQFLSHIFNGVYSLEEAKYHAKELDFEILEEGIIIIIEICPIDILKDNQYWDLIECAVENILGKKTVFSYCNNNKIAILIPDDAKKYLPLIEQLYLKLKLVLESKDIFFGIGRGSSFKNIRQSYEEAKKAIKIGTCLNLPSKIYFFSQLGFYRLLKIPDIHEEMLRYYEDYLKPIDKKDLGKNDLLDTLTCYVECGFNYTQTASKMFVHPNTVRYRISIIEKTCRVNFKFAYDRLNMEIALKLLPLIKGVQKDSNNSITQKNYNKR